MRFGKVKNEVLNVRCGLSDRISSMLKYLDHTSVMEDSHKDRVALTIMNVAICAVHMRHQLPAKEVMNVGDTKLLAQLVVRRR